MCKFLLHYKDLDRDDRCWPQSVTACWVFLLPFREVRAEGARYAFLFGLGFKADDVI